MFNKKCSHGREDLILYFYGETDEATAIELETRIELCASCRDYYESLTAMETALPRTPAIEPDAKIMTAVRSETHARIRAVETAFGSGSRSSGHRPHSSIFGRSFSGPSILARYAVVAIAVVTVFLAGRYAAPVQFIGTGADSRRIVATVSDLQFNEETGLISVHFRTEQNEVVSGSVDNPEIRFMLEKALSDAGNPSARLRAARLLSRVDLDPVLPIQDFLDALQHILTDETNVGIQLQAVKALHRVHGNTALSEDLSSTLLELLETSSNSALRIEILGVLTDSELARQDLKRILQRATTDENSFIRHQARDGLKDLDDSVRLEELY